MRPADAAGLALLGLLGAVLPGLVLLGTPTAHGYDGWYYVLQVRTLLEGEPLFADRSLVFGLLAVLGTITGDVVLGNKLGASLFGSLTAVLGGVAGWRWSGSRWGGLACGLWWAASPLHLAGTVEYLKNAGGVVLLAALLAVLPRAELRKERVLLFLFLMLLGAFVHKLTFMLGLVVFGAWGLSVALGGQLPRRLVLAALGLLGLLAVAGVAGSYVLLRPEDLGRFTDEAASRGRWWALTGGRLALPERLELWAVHLAPLGLAALAWRAEGSTRAALLGALALALVCLAPGLPFAYDHTSWRLMLMGFLPLGLLLAVLSAGRAGPVICALLAAVGLWGAATLPPVHAARSPDYLAWEAVLPELQATVAPDERVVAHRGLCGWIYAVAERPCESFLPEDPEAGWWRVAYGFSAERLAPWRGPEDPAPVALIPGYSLVPEPAWRRFVEAEGARFTLTRDERNPHEPRPGFVYAPGAAGDDASE